jgi:hypothetical protein
VARSGFIRRLSTLQVLRVLGQDESQLSPPEPPAALQSPLPSPAARTSTAGHSPTHGLQQPTAHAQQQPAGLAGLEQQGGGAGGVAAAGDHVAAVLDAHLAVEQINTPQARYVGRGGARLNGTEREGGGEAAP